MVPTAVEEIYSHARLVQQAFIYGDNKPFNVLLVIPDYLEIKKWFDENKSNPLFQDLLPYLDTAATDDASFEKIFHNETILKEFMAELVREGERTRGYERAVRFDILREPFSQDNNKLTPKMSMKRKVIVSEFGPLLEEIYKCNKGFELAKQVNN